MEGETLDPKNAAPEVPAAKRAIILTYKENAGAYVPDNIEDARIRYVRTARPGEEVMGTLCSIDQQGKCMLIFEDPELRGAQVRWISIEQLQPMNPNLEFTLRKNVGLLASAAGTVRNLMQNLLRWRR